jgi:hypothetical protein
VWSRCGLGSLVVVEGSEPAVYARAEMPKQLKAILTDGTNRTIDVPADLNIDDMYEVKKWALEASQEWLSTDEGNSFLEPLEPFATSY